MVSQKLQHCQFIRKMELEHTKTKLIKYVQYLGGVIIIIKNHGSLSSVLSAYCTKNYWVHNALMHGCTIPSKLFK